MLQRFAADGAFLILAKVIFRAQRGELDERGPAKVRGKEREREEKRRRDGREKERESRGWQFPVITANPYFIA